MTEPRTTLTIRIDPELKSAVERAAIQTDRTVTLFVCRALKAEIARADIELAKTASTNRRARR